MRQPSWNAIHVSYILEKTDPQGNDSAANGETQHSARDLGCISSKSEYVPAQIMTHMSNLQYISLEISQLTFTQKQ